MGRCKGFVVVLLLMGLLGVFVPGMPVARAAAYYNTMSPTTVSLHYSQKRIDLSTDGVGRAFWGDRVVNSISPSDVTVGGIVTGAAPLYQDYAGIKLFVPEEYWGSVVTFSWNVTRPYGGSTWNYTSSATVYLAKTDYGGDEYKGLMEGAPVEVALTGPNLVVPSLGFLYTATISGGTTPYAVQFSKMKSGGTSYWYYDAVNTSSTVVQQYISFDQVGTYTARVVVIDGESTSVQDTMTVTVVERKPDLWGVVLIEGGELQFALSGAEGGAKPEWGYGVYYPTSVYTVKAPSWRSRESDHYTLDLDAPYPNPLVVAVRYTDPSTGSAWDYEFTFDMTDVDEEDEWIDSNGVGEVSLVDTLPEWLKALLDGIRDVFEKLFRWLFVPTSEQVSDLLPSGSLGASLLDGVAWTGAEAGEYTLHAHWTVNGSEVEVPLVSFNVSSVAASPFVGAVRKIVQAGVCLALVYMVVVLV